MKKILLIVLCLALVGCLKPGVMISKVLNGMAVVEAVICGSTSAEVADAIQANQFIASHPAIQAKVANAWATFKAIQDKGCYLLSQLQAALQQFDDALASMPVQGVETIPPLTALRKKAVGK